MNPRLRALPLPNGEFLLVFDRVEAHRFSGFDRIGTQLKEQAGAAGIVVLAEDVELPAVDYSSF